MHALFIGRATVDLIQAVDVFPGPDDKATARGTALTGGGPALNAAITFAHLSRHDGGRATLAARVGRDNLLSDLLREECARFGVELVDLAGDPAFRPCVSGVLSTLSTGTRCCVTGPEAHESESDVAGGPGAPGGLGEPPGAALPELDAFDVILLDQYQLDVVRAHAAALRAAPAELVLDGGGWKAWSDEMLRLASLPIVSERFLEGHHAPAAEVLAGYGFDRFAVTQGPRGVSYRDRGADGRLPAPPVEALDTLAAGDIFHGAFCFYHARGDGFADALAAAAQVAAQSTRYLGPRAWMTSG
jgi:sugar/nucleoside kinase (ribokinase family)